jgi:hypothetical protein
MMLGPFRTNYRVWVFAASCLFMALGFVDPVAGATWKGDNSFWSHVGILLRRVYFCSTADLVDGIMLQALLQAVPAVVFGWVLQAFVVIFWSVARGMPHSSGAVVHHQGTSTEPATTADRPRE